jgi:hypothetical protein
MEPQTIVLFFVILISPLTLLVALHAGKCYVLATHTVVVPEYRIITRFDDNFISV